MTETTTPSRRLLWKQKLDRICHRIATVLVVSAAILLGPFIAFRLYVEGKFNHAIRRLREGGLEVEVRWTTQKDVTVVMSAEQREQFEQGVLPGAKMLVELSYLTSHPLLEDGLGLSQKSADSEEHWFCVLRRGKTFYPADYEALAESLRR